MNLLRLAPGVWSSQRHWHAREDEFVHVLEGEVVLVTNGGEEILRAGDSAGFKGGDPDGHQIVNRSERDAVLLEIGTRSPGMDDVDYPDVDLRLRNGRYEHTDGTPYGTAPPKKG